jgi:hypothetical protein
MVNEASLADQARTIARRGLTDEQYAALLAVQEFADEDDWLQPPETVGAYWFMPVRFQAYLDHFKPVGAPPAECFDLCSPAPAEFERWKAVGQADYTYFALGQMDGAIKIGMSRQPEFRISTLRHEGQPAEPLAIIPGGYLERAYHRVFKRWRIESEWFAPHPDLLAEINQLRA